MNFTFVQLQYAVARSGQFSHAAEQCNVSQASRVMGELAREFVSRFPKARPLGKRDRIAVADLPEDEIILLRDGHCLRNQALELCRIATTQPGVFADQPARSSPTMSEHVTFETGSFETLLPIAEIVRIVTERVEARLSALQSSGDTNPLEPFPAHR